MRIIIICTLILPIILLAGCGNKKESGQSLITDNTQANNVSQNVEQNPVVEDTPPMSGWKCYGLLGRVKLVRYADKGVLQFNENGNLTKETSVWADASIHTITNVYSSLNEYAVTDDWNNKINYKIKYEKNMRLEIEQESSEHFQSVFTFDNKGRLIKSEPNVGFDALTIEYKYKKETDLFPYKEITESSYEGGDGSFSKISTFEYLKTDDRGNWLERKIEDKITEYIPSWDETTKEEKTDVKVTNQTKIEKREIVYF